jgi:hypothetical protein
MCVLIDAASKSGSKGTRKRLCFDFPSYLRFGAQAGPSENPAPMGKFSPAERALKPQLTQLAAIFEQCSNQCRALF